MQTLSHMHNYLYGILHCSPMFLSSFKYSCGFVRFSCLLPRRTSLSASSTEFARKPSPGLCRVPGESLYNVFASLSEEAIDHFFFFSVSCPGSTKE